MQSMSRKTSLSPTAALAATLRAVASGRRGPDTIIWRMGKGFGQVVGRILDDRDDQLGGQHRLAAEADHDIAKMIGAAPASVTTEIMKGLRWIGDRGMVRGGLP